MLRGWVLLAMIAAFAIGCSDKVEAPEVSDPNNGFTDGPCGSDFDCELGSFCIRGECVGVGDECTLDDDCQTGFGCQNGYCLEVPVECTVDGDCTEGEICEDNACNVGCREDSQCGEGRICNPNTNRCLASEEDCGGECPDHTACNALTAECEPDGTCTDTGDCTGDLVCSMGRCIEDTTCDRNDECPERQWCNPETAQCEPGCRQANECRIEEICIAGQCIEEIPECDADRFEPNDVIDEATALGIAPLEDLTLCDEEDWFQFTAFEGDALTVTLSFIHDRGNINMELYDTRGEALQLSASQDDNEVLRRTLDTSGTYSLRVFGAGRGIYSGFDVALDLERNCSDDDSEDNDTAETAATLDPEAGALEDRFVCEADDDWFAVDLFPGETLTATITYDSVFGDLPLELYTPDETLIEAADTEGDSETLTYAATGLETVLLKIPGAEGQINRYAIEAAVTALDCTDDDAEDDDTPETAPEVPSLTEITGRICPGDADLVSLLAPADTTLTVGLTHTAADGDLQLALIAADGVTVLAESATAEDEETLEHVVETPGRLYVQVSGRGRSQNDYTLAIDAGIRAFCPDDDRFEDNDGFDTPGSLLAGIHADLVMCSEDGEDWYSFELAEGQSAELFALAPVEQGEVEIQLYGPEATSAEDVPLDTARGGGAVQRVQARLGTAPGLYKVRIGSVDGAEVFYSLRLNLYDGPLPLSCEFDDTFEPNNIIADAARLPDETLTGIICGDDADWFRLDAETGEVISVRADFAHEAGDIDIILHGGMPLMPIAQARSQTDGEDLVFRAEQNGPLFLEVVLATGESNVYGLTASRIEGEVPQSCVTDDIHEQNDTFAAASALPGNSFFGIHCGEDDDWFAAPLGAGRTIRADLLFEGDGALDLALKAGQDVPLAEAEAVEIPARSLTFTATEPVAAALAVTSEGLVEARYGLRVTVLDEIPLACGDADEGEPNDSPAASEAIEEAAELTGRTLCGADEDWYRVTVPSGMRLVVETSFDPAQGNLEAVALSQSGGGLAAAFSTTGLERLVVPSERVERTIYVQLFLNGATEGQVDYSASFVFDSEDGCFPDANEDNNNQGQATRVTPGTFSELSMCPEDEDWYRIDGQTLQTLTVSISFDGDAADLDLILIDGTLGAEAARSDGVGDVETATALVIFPGPFYIRVVSFDSGSSDYTMTVRLQ